MVSVLERAGQAAGLDKELEALAERVRASVVLVHSAGGFGSGVVWDSGGLIVTNNHVAGSDEVEVSATAGGRVHRGRVTARDPRNDLAVIEVRGMGLPAAALGDSGRLRVGQVVAAVGNPHGVRGVTTLGIISAVGEQPVPGRRGRRELVQADVTLAPGNSGGPLTDAAGQVVGINAMVAGPRAALAIPVNAARRFVAGELPAGARMGVAGQPAAVPLAWRRRGVEQETGVLLVGIAAGSPAEQAGLLPGDLLLALDGDAIESPQDLLEAMAERQPGVPLQAMVVRGGRARPIVVVPAAA